MKQLMEFSEFSMNKDRPDLQKIFDKIHQQNLVPVMILDMKNLKDFDVTTKINKFFRRISHVKFPGFTIVDGEIVENYEHDKIRAGKTWEIIYTVGYNAKGDALFNERTFPKELSKINLENVTVLPFST